MHRSTNAECFCMSERVIPNPRSMAFPAHSFVFQILREDQDRLPPTSLNNLPSCPTQNFHGHSLPLSIDRDAGGAPYMMKRSMSFSGIEKKQCDEGHGDDHEFSDDGSQLGEKKRRLNFEQAIELEKSFEVGKKLEPERKLQLAKALGLHPRQIAIWFQNRRARWKTKQLEKDYEGMKKQFETWKADNDFLHAQNKRLHQELMALKGRDNTNKSATIGHKKEHEGSWSNGSENSSDINLEISRNPVINCPLPPQNFKKILPSTTRSNGTTQFHPSSARSDLHGLKLDQMVQEESFCNMFSGIDEQQHNFWPWTEKQQQLVSLNQEQFVYVRNPLE